VFRKFNQLGMDFVQGYGLTETSPIITLNPVESYKEASVGRIFPQVEMCILDPDERGVGEVAVKGPMVMEGYFEMPEETKAAFTEDGWLKTGDVGWMDKENYLYLTGRAKNMIVTEGGKNVYPEEIENEFQLYEEIGQILVRGFLPDKKPRNARDEIGSTVSEHIEALIYPSPDYARAQSAEAMKARFREIIAEVNARLLPYQKIERLKLLDTPMVMTTTQKIIRRAV
jgi:long-chain acyl-CoA synthetase